MPSKPSESPDWMARHVEDVTLKQYLSERLDEQQRAVAVALAAQVKAVETALQAVEKAAIISATNHHQEHDLEKTAVDNALHALGQRLDEQKEAVAVALSAQQQALVTALQAAEQTAMIHSQAHMREHLSHERIHSVEEKHVDEARRQVASRLGALNDLRSEVTADRNLLVSREVLDAIVKTLQTEFSAGQGELEVRIDENSKARQHQAEEMSGLRGRSAAYTAALAAVFTLMYLALAFYTSVHKP